MAAADAPAGLMDIASTLSQDDIPFKLRCAICNKLAVNAFRLPCCDQSICETCQASLSDTCPVCAHTPVSPDLCKPNKALRTTLKAFLRTEEKKREKDRQSAAPPTPTIPPPTTSEPAVTEAPAENGVNEMAQAETSDVPLLAETKTDEAPTESPPAETAANGIAVNGTAESGVVESVEPEAEAGPDADQVPEAVDGEANAKPADGDATVDEQTVAAPDQPQPDPSMMITGAGSFPGMNWNGNGNVNGMNPFMANAMLNFPNPMDMSMTMDPMAANQGMFGNYGMNMTGMGMNMGMNFNGQGMYGSLGWDGSQQNMWHGGQDKYNPNAFANGMGPPYGGAFGGSNMSYPSNSGFQSGFYGPGYGRGGFRGRGRGGFQGPGRGGFAGHNTNIASFNQQSSEEGADGSAVNSESIPQAGEYEPADQTQEGTPANGATETVPEEAGQNSQQLHGIPTFDSLNHSMPMGPNGYQGPMGPGYGRGGFMRGRGGFGGGPYMPHIEQPPRPGVEGAPAAPRAMRQGLPNTSVFRQRGFHAHGKSSASSNTPAVSQRGNSEVTQDAGQTRSPSRAPSQPPQAESRPQSPSQTHPSHQMSPVVQAGDARNGRYEDEKRRSEDEYVKDRRSRSPSRMSSGRPSRRHPRDSDRDRRDGRRSHRSRRHHSRSYSRRRSRSPTRNDLELITEEAEPNGHKTASEAGDPRDLAAHINSHRSSKDRPGRRDEERDRDRARDSRPRDRDRDRGRERRDRDRNSERDRRRDPERDRGHGRDRDRERERDRDRDRDRDRGERDRKRSRRDRSESANARDDSSCPQARRVKRDTDDQDREHDKPKALATKSEPDKDPYTLEREARNRERMLREQQNRSGAKLSHSKSSHRRESRQERLVGGRRINYKYEDEL